MVFVTLCWIPRIAPLIGLVFKQAAFYLRDSSVYTPVQSVLSLGEGGNVEGHGWEREH